MQKIIKITILFIFLFVIGIFYISLTRDTNYNTSSLINKETPEFKIISFDNSNSYTRDDIKKNNYTLINFWASWCLPCEVEHPYLMAIKEKNNLIMIGINYKDKEEDAKIFIEDKGNPYDYIGRDDSGFFGIDMGITGVPETFIVDEKGIIVLRHVGPIDFSDRIAKP